MKIEKQVAQPVAPVVQLVTSEPSDTLGREFESRRSHTNRDFSSQKTRKKKRPTSGERLIRGYTKFDFTVNEHKGRLNPYRDIN